MQLALGLGLKVRFISTNFIKFKILRIKKMNLMKDLMKAKMNFLEILGVKKAYNLRNLNVTHCDVTRAISSELIFRGLTGKNVLLHKLVYCSH
jgi:hypothetical protein